MIDRRIDFIDWLELYSFDTQLSRGGSGVKTDG